MFFATKLGMIGRGDFGLAPGDQLADSKLTSGSDEMVLITRHGQSIRFAEEEAKSMEGVRGISLADGDAVVALAGVIPDASLLVVTEHGIGKRIKLEDFRLQSPGGKGIPAIQINEWTGSVVGALIVKEEAEVMLIIHGGQMVRIAVKDVREAGRHASCVKLISLADGKKLLAIAPVNIERRGQP